MAIFKHVDNKTMNISKLIDLPYKQDVDMVF